MIKAFFFDAGGVYLKSYFDVFVNDACRLLNIPKKSVSDFPHLPSDLMVSKISLEQAFEEFFETKIGEKDMSVLKVMFLQAYDLDPEMHRLVFDLKKNYKVGILSNSVADTFPYFKQKKWYEGFHAVILSHERGIGAIAAGMKATQFKDQKQLEKELAAEAIVF